MLEFFDPEDVYRYTETKWKEYFDSLPGYLRENIISFKSSGRRRSNASDKEVISAAEVVIKEIPPFDEDVLLFRGGRAEDFCDDRPFLAASFLRRTAERWAREFNGKVYTIRVSKGSRAIPIGGFGLRENDTEQEVLIETKHIHRICTRCKYY